MDKKLFDFVYDLTSLEEQITGLVKGRMGLSAASALTGTEPKLEMYQTAVELVIRLAIPGLEKSDDVHIGLEGERLCIDGEIPRFVDDQPRHMLMSEFSYGHFKRIVRLPVQVKQDGVRATYRNGILEIRLLKERKGLEERVTIKFL